MQGLRLCRFCNKGDSSCGSGRCAAGRTPAVQAYCICCCSLLWPRGLVTAFISFTTSSCFSQTQWASCPAHCKARAWQLITGGACFLVPSHPLVSPAWPVLTCFVVAGCRCAGMDGYRMDGKALTVRIAGQKDPPRTRSGRGDNEGGEDRVGQLRGPHGVMYAPPGAPPVPPGERLGWDTPPPHCAGVDQQGLNAVRCAGGTVSNK